ncbi:MAG: hypothetical protein JNK60_22635 [Acidobacteria bacterium]|nr:hypothetical protein [Acidobacteriota bacterium]
MATNRIFHAAVLAVAIAVAGCSGDADFSQVAPEPVLLVAEDYQEDILAIDRLVFAPGPWDDGRRTALAKRLEGVAGRVKEGSTSKFLLLESLELKRLAGIVKRVSANAPKDPIENDWMRLRNNLFDDRAWFARSARDLEAVPVPTAVVAAVGPVDTPVPESQPEAGLRPDQHVRSGGGYGAPAPRSLAGSWRVTELRKDGLISQDKELEGALLSFEAGRLTVTAGGRARDTGGRAQSFVITDVPDSPSDAFRVASDERSEGPKGSGWMLFEIVGSDLRLAFYDGLAGRPPGFEAGPKGQGPALIVLRLTRGS